MRPLEPSHSFTIKEITDAVQANPNLIKDPEGIQAVGELLWHARWNALQYDMNSDGAFTISDIVDWIWWALAMPGDLSLITSMIWAPGIAQFFEISPSLLGGWLSTAISIVTWFVVAWVDEFVVLVLLFVLIAGGLGLFSRGQ